MTHAGFVFLSMPKAGSTAVQKHFARHAQVVFRQPPGMKHMSAVTFETTMAPWFERFGFARSSYETTCLVRHPVDRAVSWWRYRSRADVAPEKSTEAVELATFAEQLVTGAVPLGTAWNFVTSLDGALIVDRPYRFEHLAAQVGWMADRLGIAPPTLERENASPERDLVIDPGVRRLLEAHYADDVTLWEQAR